VNKLQVDGDVAFITGVGIVVTKEVVLADDASVSVGTLLGASTRTFGDISITTVSGANGCIQARLNGGSNVVSLLSGYSHDNSDTDGKLCVIAAGSGAYTIKNRLGASSTFQVVYTGRK
jgi:hypothetical protein